MSASTRSKGEQYGGYLKDRTEEEGDNAQGQDEVPGRGRSSDNAPWRRSGQEQSRSWQGNERRFYQDAVSPESKDNVRRHKYHIKKDMEFLVTSTMQ